MKFTIVSHFSSMFCFSDYLWKMRKDLVNWGLWLAVVCIAMAVQSCVQHFLSIPYSKILVVFKIGLSFFCADIVSAYWLRPFLNQDIRDEFSYNSFLIGKIKNMTAVKPWQVFAIGVLFDIIVSGALWVGEDQTTNPMLGQSIIFVILVGLLLSPLIETLIFQFLTIEFIRWITKKTSGRPYSIFAGIISAATFALMHFYSAKYIVSAFITGLYLSFVYIFFCVNTGEKKRGFFATVLMHLLLNLLPFAQMFLFK